MSGSERLYPRHPVRALRARLHLLTSVAAETRQHVLESRDAVLASLHSLAGKVDALAETQRGDREWLRETLRVMHDREPEQRRHLSKLRASESYDALYETEEPLVSIVIPTFDNYEHLAQRAIPSILEQTYQRFEVIVVGDAAPEAASELVASFGDPRLSFHNLELRGPYPEEPWQRWLVAGVPPYNEAVRRASGTWIAPLDDDDAFRPDHIEVLLDAARGRRLEFVYGVIAQHEPNGDCTYLGSFPPSCGQVNLQAALYRADLGELFQLELADAVFGQPSDWGLCQRMARAGVRMGIVDQVVVDYYPSSVWAPLSDRSHEAQRGADHARETTERISRPGAGQSAPPARDRAAPVSAVMEWEYRPEGWTGEHTNRHGQGWEVESVASMYAQRWPAFIEGLQGSEPLGAIHVVPVERSIPREDLISHNMVMVFAYTLALSAHMAGNLSVLDWGGALGHYHALARVLMPDLALDYHCKELPAVCEQGRRVSPEVTFHESDACLKDSYDLVLASGAIQYAEDWTELLTRLARATRRFLLITKVPVTDAPSFVVLQRAHRYGYDTEYLGWALNTREIRTAGRSAGLEIVREFFLSASVDVPNAPSSIHHRGFLFASNQDAET